MAAHSGAPWGWGRFCAWRAAVPLVASSRLEWGFRAHSEGRPKPLTYLSSNLGTSLAYTSTLGNFRAQFDTQRRPANIFGWCGVVHFRDAYFKNGCTEQKPRQSGGAKSRGRIVPAVLRCRAAACLGAARLIELRCIPIAVRKVILRKSDLVGWITLVRFTFD